MRPKRSLQLAPLCLALGMGLAKPASASWGAELPFLAEIVTNTLYTLYELRNQSNLLREELRGIQDKIHRLKSVQELLSPKDLESWKNPGEALNRLRQIYETLPPQFRTEKSRQLETQLSEAMGLAGRLTKEAKPAFASGKQLEKNSLEASPAVANKMTASGVGTLVSLQSQNQVAQAQIISLLSQMIAEGASKETARINSQALEYKTLGSGLQGFSSQIQLLEVRR